MNEGAWRRGVNVDEIPFGEIAFSSMTIVLEKLIEDVDKGALCVHHGVIHKKEGYSPSDPMGYELRDYIAMTTTKSAL
ncbi:hypothetical protein CYMTET_56713 [Cymbomonas tetramitiformis]|uniref:Uncharacterized protein n=1 Tax=Cymbomonas tetramitiformis TaxID=36881 RepID=A0AAE0BAD6_9CHLO|nr:hypothetical protein CYMTET_56713 [Cymbomonas tetramitiformis]